MSEKCQNNKHNNNSDNPLTSRRTDGGKNTHTHAQREVAKKRDMGQ